MYQGVNCTMLPFLMEVLSYKDLFNAPAEFNADEVENLDDISGDEEAKQDTECSYESICEDNDEKEADNVETLQEEEAVEEDELPEDFPEEPQCEQFHFESLPKDEETSKTLQAIKNQALNDKSFRNNHYINLISVFFFGSCDNSDYRYIEYLIKSYVSEEEIKAENLMYQEEMRIKVLMSEVLTNYARNIKPGFPIVKADDFLRDVKKYIDYLRAEYEKK